MTNKYVSPTGRLCDPKVSTGKSVRKCTSRTAVDCSPHPVHEIHGLDGLLFRSPYEPHPAGVRGKEGGWGPVYGCQVSVQQCEQGALGKAYYGMEALET